jgi:hypothetical protein
MARIGIRKGNIRKISVSISEDSADWLEAQVEALNYRSVSHAVDSVIHEAKKSRQLYRPLSLLSLSDDHY